MNFELVYWIATRLAAVRQYQIPSTNAGDASVRSPSELVCISLNSRPALTTKVSPSSLVKKTSPFTITGDAEKPKGAVKRGDKKAALKDLAITDGRLAARFDAAAFDRTGLARLTAAVTYAGGKPDRLVGAVVWPDESTTAFVAARGTAVAQATPGEPIEAPKLPGEKDRPSFPVNYPLGEYGRSGPPEQPFVVFANATGTTVK